MQKGYISELHKNTLAYNLLVHITEKLQLDDTERQIVSTTIKSLLTNFEYKESEENK